MECKDEPTAPALPPFDWTSIEAAKAAQAKRDGLTLDYVLAWRSAHGDCAAKVLSLREWAESMKD